MPTYDDPGALAGAHGAGTLAAGQRRASDNTTPADRLGLLLLDWRPTPNAGFLRGRAKARLANQLEIADIGVFQKDGRSWAQLPAEIMRDAAGQPLKDERGKPRYRSPLKWATWQLQNEFSASLIEAVERQHGPLGDGP